MSNSRTRFGIREVCHCVFTSENPNKSPSFVIDTAKMSSIESSSTTVYAQGGSGNSRLIAWEGEKTMTFTVEDALITKESFAALTGADWDRNNTFKIKPTSFAGYYSITAYTLFRDEDGMDHLATLTFPRAKLQTQLNLSMGPTGDPSTFTFTFDAFPDLNNDRLMFQLELQPEDYVGDLADRTQWPTDTLTTTVYINGAGPYKTTATEPTLELKRGEGDILSIVLMPEGDPITETVSGNELLTNFGEDLQESGDAAELTPGSTTRWYII